MSRQYVRKPVSWAKIGPNARSNLGDEKKARALARSRIKCQITPLIARSAGIVLDGNRTIWGAQLEGLLDAELDFIITDEELAPEQVRVMQANSAMHREPLSDADFATVLQDTLTSNPGMTRKQLSEDLFDIDPSLATRYLTLFVCIATVQEAARAGLIGVSDWYAIHRASDQQDKLDKRLKGATRDAIADEVRRECEGADKPKERTTRIRIPLAVCEGETQVNGTVTVSGLPGQEIGFDEANDLLKEAMKAVREAQKRKLGLKAAQAAWKDVSLPEGPRAGRCVAAPGDDLSS